MDSSKKLMILNLAFVKRNIFFSRILLFFLVFVPAMNSCKTGAPLIELKTEKASRVTQTTAIVEGNLAASNVKDVISKGICWNTTGEPSLSDKKLNSGSDTGRFVCAISGLRQALFITQGLTPSANLTLITGIL